MSLETPKYIIMKKDERSLSGTQLKEILKVIPLHIEISNGYGLSLESSLRRERDSEISEPILIIKQGAQIISMRPKRGKRLSDACFYTERMKAFYPSRVMDETTGGGACCSYGFNTKDLGLPFEKNIMLDIYKLG